MSKGNGFIFFETIIASTVVLATFFILVPAIITIETEKRVLFDRRTIANLLSDELQIILAENKINPENSYQANHKGLLVFYHFTSEQELIKGCATWENIKKVNEDICFYGIQK